MAFRFGIPNVAFRKRMSWTDFTVACVVGVIAGIYTFKPGLQQAKEAVERREALKEIQARRKAEAEKDKKMPVGNFSSPPPPPIINRQKPKPSDMPTRTAWIATFKRLFSSAKHSLRTLWLTGGILFSLYGKRAIRRREEELVIEDIENYLGNKSLDL